MKLSRDALIALVERICAADGSEDEIHDMLQQLKAAMPLVPWTEFIFWPSGCPHPVGAPETTPEQIVDRAIAFRPSIIIIPPSTFAA